MRREYRSRGFSFSIWYIEHRLRTRYRDEILIIKSEIHLLYLNSGYLELGFILYLAYNFVLEVHFSYVWLTFDCLLWMDIWWLVHLSKKVPEPSLGVISPFNKRSPLKPLSQLNHNWLQLPYVSLLSIVSDNTANHLTWVVLLWIDNKGKTHSYKRNISQNELKW